MIAQTEFQRILLWSDEEFRKHILGWGVVHAIQFVGQLQHAMAEYARAHPYEQNNMRGFYINKIRMLEKLAYEKYVIVRRRELYRENPLYLSHQQDLKGRIRKEFRELCDRHYY